MHEQELIQLVTTIRNEVVKRWQANTIATRRQIRVRRRDMALQYSEDFGFANFEPERMEQDVWDWQDHETFHDTFVKTLPEYKSLVLARPSQVGMIDNFLRSVSFASVHGLDDNEVLERTSALGRELEGQPLPVRVTAFIDGLRIASSPLAISDRLTLRQPSQEDMAEYVLLDEYGGLSVPLGHTWFKVVGEFTFDAAHTGIAQSEFHRTIEALRLFRVGGIAAHRYVMKSRHTFFGGGTLTSGGFGRSSRFVCTLTTADVVTLDKFLKDVVSVIPDPFRPGEATTAIEIASRRYADALFQEDPIERSITSAITALEALFLDEQSELTHRLAQRVALFLRVLGPQPDARNTYDQVKRGYKIRSTFIHGGSLKVKDRPQADALAPALLEYTRQCVLAFRQIAAPKKGLLAQIDRALIDPASTGDLLASLAPVTHR